MFFKIDFNPFFAVINNPMYADKCKPVRVQTAKKQVQKYLAEGWQVYIENRI